MRAFVALWDEITRERYGVTDPAQRRFRYGVQVNSLGLTEAQPENNVQRIVLEMLGGDAVPGRAGAGGAAAGVERGARPAPAVGPAVVAADAAGPRLRVRPARVRRPVRRFHGRRGGGRAVARGGARRDRDGAADGWRGRRGGVRLHEVGDGGRALAAAPPDRVRRAGRGRRQPVPEHGAQPADGGPRHRHPGGRPRRRGPCRRGRGAVAGRARPHRWRGGGGVAGAAARRRRVGCQPHGRLAAVRPGRRHHRRVDGSAARGVRGVPRADRGLRRRWGRPTRAPTWTSPRCASWCAVRGRSSGRGCACSWASRGWTATATARSRWPCGPATRGSRWSTRASGSPPTRSWPRRSPRTCTVSGCRCCPGRTCSWCRTSWPGCGRPARATCRWWSAASSPRPTPQRCGGSVSRRCSRPRTTRSPRRSARSCEVIRAARGLDTGPRATAPAAG